MSLLQELLTIVSAEHLTTPGMLAQRLNISRGLVELMLVDLERAGYLRVVNGDCGGCAGCGPRQTCRSPRSRFWIRAGR